MISAPIDLAQLEAVIQLLVKYELDEFQDEHFTIKKTRHKPDNRPATPQDLLAKHLEPLPEEPWMSVSDGALTEFSISGKVR